MKREQRCDGEDCAQGTRAGKLMVDAAATEICRTVELGSFPAEAADEEAARLGISVEDLVSFSVLYYLADLDSGRIARQIPRPLIRSEAG